MLPEAFVEIVMEFQVLVLELSFSAFREFFLLHNAPTQLLQMRQELSVLVIGAPKGAPEIHEVQTIRLLRSDPENARKQGPGILDPVEKYRIPLVNGLAVLYLQQGLLDLFQDRVGIVAGRRFFRFIPSGTDTVRAIMSSDLPVHSQEYGLEKFAEREFQIVYSCHQNTGE